MIGKQSFNTAASYRDKNADIYKLGQAILTKTLLTSQATTKIVMPLPRFEDVFGSGSITYRDFYQEVADRTDSIFLDCIAAFKTSSKSELESFFLPNDGHFSSLGHERIANYLATNISKFA